MDVARILLFIFLTLFLPQSCGYSWLSEFDKQIQPLSIAQTLQTKAIPIQSTTVRSFKHVESARVASLSQFHKRNRPDSKRKHDGYFMIRIQDEEKLKSLLNDVANPISPNYAQYYTRDQIVGLAYDANSHNHVLRYLEMKGFKVHNYVAGSGIIHASAPIHLWESELSTEFYEFEPQEQSLSNVRVIRAESYSLPSELQYHVSYVLNIVSFPLPSEIIRSRIPKRTPISKKIDLSGKPFVNGYVTPALINKFYDIRNNTGSRHASQGVYETIDQTYSPSDLTVFQKYFGLPVEKVARVIGGHANNNACLKNHGNDCIEANLDIQYIMAVGQHITSVYYYWNGEDFMLDWLNAVLKMSNPPQVLSISYGADEVYITNSYAMSFNQAAIRLGLMGVTLVASSGDDGAISTSARDNPLMCGYAPSFPASSPYVVAVGGTMGPEDGLPEVACQGDRNGIITTGGGFSALYEVPSWQRALTAQYLNLVDGTEKAPVSGFARMGRGIPDISFLAHNYIIAVANNFTAVSGTSASSPVFAGMIALVNSARIEKGLNPVGWILPALYAYAQDYVYDVTDGHNHCTADGLVCCAQGFKASTGWDPVTGLGSLNFTRFMEKMVSMGSTSPTFSPTYRPGSPTPKPSRAPVGAPSVRPTAAPVMSKGYIRVLEYTDTDCGGDVTTVSGAATNTCLTEYDADGNIVGALKYTCRNDGAALSVYSAVNCLEKDKLQEQVFSYGCAYRVATDYYATDFYSMEIDCIQGTSSAAILEGLSGRYALQNSYDSTSGCDVGTESSAMAILQGHCFPVEEKGYSYEVTFPDVNYYRSTDCSGRVEESETLNTQCAEVEMESSYGSYGSYDSSSTSWRKKDHSKQNDFDSIESLESSDTETSTSNKRQLTSKLLPVTSFLDVEEASALEEIAAEQNTLTKGMVENDLINFEGSSYYSSGPQGTVDLFAIWSDQTVDNADKSKSARPTVAPTEQPVKSPSQIPTQYPSLIPSVPPSLYPSSVPSSHPTITPTTSSPTNPLSTNKPTRAPSFSLSPSQYPSIKPTIAPSLRPSEAPTVAITNMPTIVNGDANNGVVVIFVHLVSGVNHAQWKSCGSACIAVWQQSIRDILPTLSGKNIQMVHVTDVVISNNNNNVKAVLASSYLNITYVVSATPSQFHVTTNQATFNAVSETMTHAVGDGSFDRRVHYRAAASQVIPLLSVTSSSDLLQITPTTASASDVIYNNPSDDDESSDGTSTSSSSDTTADSARRYQQLVWILVGVALVAVAVAGGILYFFCCRSGWDKNRNSLFLNSRHGEKLFGDVSSDHSSSGGSGRRGGGSGGRRKGPSAYVALPLTGGESLHGEGRRSGFGAVRSMMSMMKGGHHSAGDEYVEASHLEDGEDIEVIEFSPSHRRGYRNNDPGKDEEKGVVTNPVLFRASMIQNQEDI